MDEVVVAAGPRGDVAERESEGRPENANQQSFHQKNTPYLAWLDTIAHHHCDVAGLFHHHHGEGDENVERCHHDNESDHDESDFLLQFESAEQFAILLDPVVRHKAGARRLFDFTADFRSAVEVVDFEADDGEQVGFVRRGAARPQGG